MREVKIEKSRLLDVLKTNKKAHEDAFHEASEAFYKNFIEDLQSVTRDVTEKKSNYEGAMKIFREERPPLGHCDEYERQIRMLEFDTREVVDLTQEEFTKFVMDEWSWKEEFAASYLSTTGKGLR